MWFIKKNIFIFLLSALMLSQSMAKNFISLDINHADVQEILQMLAKEMQVNIIMSREVAGDVSLHVTHFSAEQIFDLVLTQQGLIKVDHPSVWFIMTRKEWIQYEEEQKKLVTIVNEAALLSTKVWQIHYAKVADIAHLLQDTTHSLLSSRGSLHIDERTNCICIEDTAEKLSTINHLILQLDVPVKQVMIAAKLVNVDTDFERDLGIHFVLQEAGKASEQYSLAVATLADGTQLDMQLAALEKKGNGKVISSPRLFTSNLETASIESGEEIPYQEVSRSGATSVAFKKAVLSLKVTPHILPQGQILLELQVNQDQPSNRLVLGVPAIKTRQVNTHVLIRNGQTVVLGGIFETSQNDEKEGLPYLSKIPLVGWLFHQQNVTTNKRELIIFVTPTIIDAVK